MDRRRALFLVGWAVLLLFVLPLLSYVLARVVGG